MIFKSLDWRTSVESVNGEEGGDWEHSGQQSKLMEAEKCSISNTKSRKLQEGGSKSTPNKRRIKN